MIHKTHVTFPTPTNPGRLRSAAQSCLDLDDARTRTILKSSLTWNDQVLDEHLTNESPFDPPSRA